MAYLPIAPNLPNGAVFTTDHIAHIESGILNADVDSREYIDGIAAQIQAGQVTDPAFDAAVDRAAADGRLVIEGGGGAAPGVEITETLPGAYQFVSGETSATLYGLTSEQKLPAAAKTDLRADFATNEAIAAAGYLNDATAFAPSQGSPNYAPATGSTVYATKAEAETTDAKVNTIVTGSTTTAASLAARFATKMPKALNLRDYGALGNNTVDDAAFLAVATAAKNGERTSPNGLMTDRLGTVTIDIPAGDFRITQLQGLLGREGMFMKVRGLRFRGAGSDLTHIIFDPAEAGELCYNRYWQNVSFEGMTFSATKTGSTFMHSWAISGSAPQELTFTDVKWNGPWKYGFNLQGTNNNCEFRFYSCATSGMAPGGAFLYAGATDTSDQFVNYWFYGFKHWVTDSPLIDMARGGHIHIYGLDASAWGNNLTAPGYLFNLRGNNHGQGTMMFTAHPVRVEPKNAFAGLLFSEWPDGNVDIQCDWSSQAGVYNYGDVINISVSNTGGAIYNFHDSFLAGSVKVKYGPSAYLKQQSISFTNCNWRGKMTPSEVVVYDETDAGGNRTRPAVNFRKFRAFDHQNPRVAAGASVQDATVGYNRGPLVKSLEKRSLMVQAIYGSLATGDGTMTVNLPVGALITGLRAVSPVTTNGDTTGGTWNLTTSDATPVTIASLTVEGTLGAGFNKVTELPVPFLCDTRERASVKLSAVGVDQSRYESFVTVEGYW